MCMNIELIDWLWQRLTACAGIVVSWRGSGGIVGLRCYIRAHRILEGSL